MYVAIKRMLPPMPHLRLLLLRVCKVHLGPGRPRCVASLNRAIYRRVQLPSITESRKTGSLVAVGRRHFSRQVRSANDVSKPLMGEEGDHFGLRDAWYVARSLARSAVYYN